MRDVDPKYLIVQPVEFGGVPRPRLRLKDVYAVYAGQFRRWFAITAPTSLLAAVVVLMANRKISEIYRSFPITQISHHSLEVTESGALRYGSFLISWFLGCLALAAIATVANGLDEGDRVSSGPGGHRIYRVCLVPRAGRGELCPLRLWSDLLRFYGRCQYRQLVRNGDPANSRAGHERLGGFKKKPQNQQWTRGFPATPRFRVYDRLLRGLVRSFLRIEILVPSST